MVRPGPPAKPTALKLLHGVHKQNPSRVNRSEPQPAADEVAPPAWLTDAAVAVWEALADDLTAKGVLTGWDVEAFACWCDAVVRRRRAAAAVEAEGEIVDLPVFNKNGEHTGDRRGKNPWLMVLSEADAQVQRYGARFGLTPSDRSHLSIGGEEKPGGAERLLS